MLQIARFRIYLLLILVGTLLASCSSPQIGLSPAPTERSASPKATLVPTDTPPPPLGTATIPTRPTNTSARATRPTLTATPRPSAQPTAQAGDSQPVDCTILFDNAHAETAGNADWIISSSQPDPLEENPNPQRETDWTGGLSSWGVALYQAGGYQMWTLPTSGRLTYGANGDLDLANFRVLIIPEPNTQFSSAEKKAIVDFVREGGGLFMISDHNNSDRNFDGWDSPKIWNDLIDNNGVQANPFGLRFDLADISNEDPKKVNTDRNDPLIFGPFGTVRGTILRSGTTITADPNANPAAQGAIWRNNAQVGSTRSIVLARSEYGTGRVVALGDSSPIEDETGRPGNRLYDGWDDPAGTNSTMALNATAWLCGAGSAGDGPQQPTAAAAAPTSAPTTAASNPDGTCPLLPNGDFESSDLSAWNVPSGAQMEVSNADPHSGGGSLAVTHSNTRDRGGPQGAEIEVTNIRGGSKYTLDGWIRADSNVDQVRVRVAWYNCTNFNCNANNTDVTLPNGASWQQFSAAVTAPNNARAARIRLQFSNRSANPTTVYYDDLQWCSN